MFSSIELYLENHLPRWSHVQLQQITEKNNIDDNYFRVNPLALCENSLQHTGDNAESDPGQLLFFLEKRAVLGLVDLFVVPLPFYLNYTCHPTPEKTFFRVKM